MLAEPFWSTHVMKGYVSSLENFDTSTKKNHRNDRIRTDGRVFFGRLHCLVLQKNKNNLNIFFFVLMRQESVNDSVTEHYN